MPLFGWNKFSPKKTPSRKSFTSGNSEEQLEELVSENRSVKLKLGNHELRFDNGEWVPEQIHTWTDLYETRLHYIFLGITKETIGTKMYGEKFSSYTIEQYLHSSFFNYKVNIVLESGLSGNTHKTNKKLQIKLEELQEENNMLKLKYDVLINMLTQTTAESHIQQREIEKLRRITKRK